MLNLIIRMFLSFGAATIVSALIVVLLFFILKSIVYVFSLNYGRDTYWVLTICKYALYFSWIVSLAYFLTVFK